MDLSADVAAIAAQAPDWNLAGDCALLDLMKRISQNLQERGELTIRNLKEFETGVRRTEIALDNATNSLRSLQFGQQFVEYRVEEVADDDFGVPEEQMEKAELPLKSSQELAKEFLQNNLQMFRKNFEEVTIEVPDSDDEDDAVNATTVYRDKNPYDAIPLPFIIGSKEWQEHKYAGLYDSSENSENERPEQFSSSSSDEQEATAPQATPKQQSNSSSLASLHTEHSISSHTTSTLQLPAQIVAPSRTQPRPIISMHRNPHESDLFTALRASPPSDDPRSSSSSLNSSPAVSHRNAATMAPSRANASLSSSSSSVSRVIPADRQTPPKLFEDDIPPVSARESATPIEATLSDVKPVAAASQIKRKPVNLFNDDEFHSFMSEIVDKVHSKSGSSSKPVKESIRQPLPPQQEVQQKPIDTPKSRANLFDDSPSSLASAPPAAQTVKPPLPTSLFDDNLEDEVDDFMSAITPKTKPQPQPLKKSLFDDDDDLDIDDIFAKTAPAVQPPKAFKKPIVKTSLFDEDAEDDVGDIFGQIEKNSTKTENASIMEPSKALNRPLGKSSLFDDDANEDPRDIFGEVPKKPTITKNVPAVEPLSTQRPRLFDDLGDDDLFATPKSSKPAFDNLPIEPERPVKQLPTADVVVESEQKPEQIESPPMEDRSAGKAQLSMPKINLFSDDFSDEEALPTVPAKTSRDTEEPTKSEARDELPAEEMLKPPAEPVVEPPAEPVLEPPAKPAIVQEKSNEVKPSLAGEQPPAAGKQQDPIISLVAELGKSKTKKETPVRAAVDVEAAQKLMQNYSSLFSDEPPDDSEFFQSLGTSSLSSLAASKMFDSEQDFYEPSLPDLPQVATEQSGNEYGGLRLFSDVPPDDDAETEEMPQAPAVATPQPELPKRIHTIFYDDFSETARAISEPAKPSSPVKKLQLPNININVQALLPGSAAPPKPSKNVEQHAPAAAAQPSAQLPNSNYSESESILQCVAKTRVRGPAHRRPSTRRARQANYVKSLVEAGSDSSMGAEPSTTSLSSSKSVDLPSVESDDGERATDDALFSAFGGRSAAPPATAAKSPLEKSKLFLDSDPEDDDDLFAKALHRKAAALDGLAKPGTATATADPLAALAKDAGTGELSTPAATSTIPADAPAVSPAAAAKDVPNATPATAPPAAAAAPLPVPTAAAVAFVSTQPPQDDFKAMSKSASFLDSDEDDSKSFLFSPPRAAPAAAPMAAASARTSSQPPKNYVSFLDNNDEDEDALFAAAAVPAATGAAAGRPTAPAAAAVGKSFLDSDDEDDALFKPTPAASKPAQLAKRVQPVKSQLFDDSDEDDDDLFGSMPKSRPAAKTKPSEEPKGKAMSAPKPNKSLFSDDEDDDDLFGSGTSAPVPAPFSAPAPAPAPARAPAAAPTGIGQAKTVTKVTAKSSDIADNPLADLLGP